MAEVLARNQQGSHKVGAFEAKPSFSVSVIVVVNCKLGIFIYRRHMGKIDFEMASTIREVKMASSVELPLAKGLISPFIIGHVIGALLLVAAAAYPTYFIRMISDSAEFSRQIGLIFLVTQLAVLLFSMHRGFSIHAEWQHLTKTTQIAFALWMATFWISSVTATNNVSYALIYSFIWLIQPIFALALRYSAKTIGRGDVRTMALAIAFWMPIFCIITAYRFIYHPPEWTVPGGIINWQFAVPGFISLRLFGAFCGAILTLLVATVLVDETDREVKAIDYAAITLLGGMTIWSGTRAAVVGFGAAMVILLLMRVHIKLKKAALLVFCALIALAGATLLIPYHSTDFMLYTFGDLQSVARATGGRDEIWSDAVDAILRAPLFGYGAGASAWVLPAGTFPHLQPHNAILEFLLCWGLVGTLPALWLLAKATMGAHVIAKQSRHVIPLLAMLDSLLVMSMFDGVFHFTQLMMLVMICYALIFTAAKTGASQPLPTVH
jgi:exopolysaccharide production protein ExoQ